jgi:hypothetical protein
MVQVFGTTVTLLSPKGRGGGDKIGQSCSFIVLKELFRNFSANKIECGGEYLLVVRELIL